MLDLPVTAGEGGRHGDPSGEAPRGGRADGGGRERATPPRTLPAVARDDGPWYQDVKAPDVPIVDDDEATWVRVVCGSYRRQRGPVRDVGARPVHLDVSIPPGKRKALPVETTSRVFAGAETFLRPDPQR
jgi:redox-sensitive bicupin YhaK (pirin superfamily)